MSELAGDRITNTTQAWVFLSVTRCDNILLVFITDHFFPSGKGNTKDGKDKMKTNTHLVMRQQKMSFLLSDASTQK